MMGWDPSNGVPTEGKRYELGVGWGFIQHFDKPRRKRVFPILQAPCTMGLTAMTRSRQRPYLRSIPMEKNIHIVVDHRPGTL